MFIRPILTPSNVPFIRSALWNASGSRCQPPTLAFIDIHRLLPSLLQHQGSIDTARGTTPCCCYFDIPFRFPALYGDISCEGDVRLPDFIIVQQFSSFQWIDFHSHNRGLWFTNEESAMKCFILILEHFTTDTVRSLKYNKDMT